MISDFPAVFFLLVRHLGTVLKSADLRSFFFLFVPPPFFSFRSDLYGDGSAWDASYCIYGMAWSD
jgi:hypothetical protein